jgi:hypothetical protein
MSDPVLKLQILARAEIALAQIRTQRATGRTILYAVAMIFGLLALGMLNFAGFHALSPQHGAAMAAFYVALADFAVAVIVILAANKIGHRVQDEKLAREVRDLAYAELNRDVQQVKEEMTQIIDDVRSIRDSFSSFSGVAMGTIAPLLKMLVGSGKKK